MLENPYNLHPAIGKDFIGRADILDAWRKRLTPDSASWESAKSWMIVGAGGMGKTSLLYELMRIAKSDFNAHVISIDLGWLREMGDTGDLFATLAREMPKAKQPGTKLRKWFDLEPDAPLGDLVGQIAGELLNQVTGFALGLVGGNAGSGIKIGNFRQKPSDLEGTAHRLAQFLINLSILSEEQDTPVIVFLDQIGKCHDHPTWVYIAGMFLALCKKMRFAGASQIFFVVSLRPEHEGLLRHRIDRRLLEKDIFIPIDLYSFSMDEAVNAISVRGRPYIGTSLARQIVEQINNLGPLDPYTIQLSSMAVWNHVVGDEHWHSPTELETDSAKLRTIIRRAHAEIVDHYMQDPIEWSILTQLAQSPGGLTISQIHHRLVDGQNLSTPEVKTAIDRLLDPPHTGYRLLTEISAENSPNRYILAHDLLKDYILSIIPEDQRLISQANKTLEYGLWRYQETRVLLSDWELELLWKVHSDITFKLEHLDMIINSELPLGSPRLLPWYRSYAKEVTAICIDNSRAIGKDKFRIRLALFSFIISSSLNQILIQPEQNSRGTENRNVDLHNPSISEQLDSKEAALVILSEVARSNEDRFIRIEAAEILGCLGDAETALQILSDLARSDTYEEVRIEAAAVLGRLGGTEVALQILSDLARNASYRDDRCKAVDALGSLGERALPILSDLAWKDRDRFVRGSATQALGWFGNAPITLPILSELAQNEEDYVVGPSAVRALSKLGEAALPILSELVHSDKYKTSRSIVVIALEELGEAALPILSELARGDKDRQIRINAAEALCRLGKAEITLPILSELARSDKDAFSHLHLIETLMQLGATEVVVPVLSHLRNHKDSKVRVYVARALAVLGKMEIASPILRELLWNDEDKIVRIHAALALGRLGDMETALPILRELARSDEAETVRIKAALALGRLSDIETALSILNELVQKSKEVIPYSADAIEALGRLGEAALPILSKWARDVDEFDQTIQIKALEALGRLGNAQMTLPILHELVRDKDEAIRLIIARALGQLGKIANQELFTTAILYPFSKSGGFAAIVLIENNLLGYFSEDLLILNKPLKSITEVRLALR